MVYNIKKFHSSIDGYLDYLHFLVVMNDAVMIVCVPIFVKMKVFIYLGCKPTSGIDESYGNCMFKF